MNQNNFYRLLPLGFLWVAGCPAPSPAPSPASAPSPKTLTPVTQTATQPTKPEAIAIAPKEPTTESASTQTASAPATLLAVTSAQPLYNLPIEESNGHPTVKTKSKALRSLISQKIEETYKEHNEPLSGYDVRGACEISVANELMISWLCYREEVRMTRTGADWNNKISTYNYSLANNKMTSLSIYDLLDVRKEGKGGWDRAWTGENFLIQSEGLGFYNKGANPMGDFEKPNFTASYEQLAPFLQPGAIVLQLKEATDPDDPSYFDQALTVPSGDRFIDNQDGTVTDRATGLMWAAKDNGADISWADAKTYCESYTAGGYQDWRMPTAGELGDLYDIKESYVPEDQCTKGKVPYHLTPLIHLNCTAVWGADILKGDPTRAAGVGFTELRGGKAQWPKQDAPKNQRALPVRNTAPTEKPPSSSPASTKSE